MSRLAQVSMSAREQVVLTKAVARAADRLAISNKRLANIIGVSPSSVTRMHDEQYQLHSGRKEWELSVLFVRMFRSLDAIAGDSGSRTWLASENHAFGDRKPIEVIESTEGLVHVCNYLDAHRGVI